jgi:hypothetical protein
MILCVQVSPASADTESGSNMRACLFAALRASRARVSANFGNFRGSFALPGPSQFLTMAVDQGR